MNGGLLDLVEEELRRRLGHDPGELARTLADRPNWKCGVNDRAGYFWLRSGTSLFRFPTKAVSVAAQSYLPSGVSGTQTA
jgi:hypothetical protein